MSLLIRTAKGRFLFSYGFLMMNILTESESKKQNNSVSMSNAMQSIANLYIIL